MQRPLILVLIRIRIRIGERGPQKGEWGHQVKAIQIDNHTDSMLHELEFLFVHWTGATIAMEQWREIEIEIETELECE